MHNSLKDILEIQELDIKMIRLMRLKKERLKELENIHSIRQDLQKQLETKEHELLETKKDVRVHEGKIDEIRERIKKLEAQQSKVRKVEEFNALSQEIAQSERERSSVEQRLSDIIDRQNAEEEEIVSIKESISSGEESSRLFEQELQESIARINDEGRVFLQERRALEKKPEKELMAVYEKLLHNKQDRVVVPIENRTCTGCHIVLTAQHENLVRKWDRLVFCEHCSRILYWQESEELEGSATAPKRRRRRASSTA